MAFEPSLSQRKKVSRRSGIGAVRIREYFDHLVLRFYHAVPRTARETLALEARKPGA
jgi:hypothetical protein